MNRKILRFEWSPEISVGNDELDRQHQMLLGQINSLVDDIIDGMKGDMVHDTILFLDRYIDGHFADEEEYMRVNGYPHIDEHIILHKGFAEKYNLFKESLENGESTEKLLSDVEMYLGKWWIEHIRKEDKKYCLYIQGEAGLT